MKWLILLMASGALAVETNTFTFTNKAGQVFENARLIKVENGEAVVIAGTVGARVKMDELPLDRQMAIAQRETEEAAKFVGVQTVWHGDEREDQVFLDGTNGMGRASAMFYRTTKGGLSRFGIAVVVYLFDYRGLDKTFEVAARGGSIEVENFKTPETKAGEEGARYSWEAILSGEIPRDQMVALAGSDDLRMTFWTQRPREGVTFRMRALTALRNFSLIAADSKEGKKATADIEDVPAPVTASPRLVEVAGATMRVTESNNSWWRYAYKVDVRNKRAESSTVELVVKFLDKDGFVISQKRHYRVQAPGGKTVSVTDFDLIDTSVAANVRRVIGEILRIDRD